MEHKTVLQSEEGKQDILITREFDLPLDLLFKAFTEPELFEEWMGTKLTHFDMRSLGSYRFETSDPNGNIVFSANGCIHECAFNTRIIRTFEMEGTPFPVQLEYLDFEELSGDTSKLTMLIIHKSVEFRDQMLQMPFAYGLNMAHNRLQESLNRLK